MKSYARIRNLAPIALLIALAPCEPRGARQPAAAGALVDRVWLRSDSTGLPGVMRIFLSDSTLVMDSCWETYRLARWQLESDSTLRWREDAADIRAAIRSLHDKELVLFVSLRSGSEEQHYMAAAVPYVCPDMKRQYGSRRRDSSGASGTDSAPTLVAAGDTMEKTSARAWRAVGTEPFWGLEINTTGLRFTTPEDRTGIRWPPLTPRVAGDTVRWVGETERAAVDTRIWPARCSDGMSDRVWRYAAVVRIDSTTYRACAESRALLYGSDAVEGNWHVVAHRAPGIAAMSPREADTWAGRRRDSHARWHSSGPPNAPRHPTT
jgi:uncharacterized membrane protein